MHVAVNAAMSVDGKLASHEREQLAISEPADFERVEALRAEFDAIMVGVGTVLADDPSLTLDDEGLIEARAEQGWDPQPARVIADSRARTPPDARVLDDQAPTFVLVSEAVPNEHVSSLSSAGARVAMAGESQVDLEGALAELESQGIDRLMVEGGGELIFSLFESGLVDELSVYVGSMVIGGRGAPTLADGPGFTEAFPDLSLEDVTTMDSGVLLEYTVP